MLALEYKEGERTVLTEIEKMLEIRQDVYDEKLAILGKIKALIAKSYQAFEEVNKPLIQKYEDKFVPEPVAHSTPFPQPEKKKSKRGRKPKKVLDEPNNLMLLAEQAAALRKSKKIRLLPIPRKRLESVLKPRKRRQTKKPKPETEPESDDISDTEKAGDQEPDENEPLYCVCSKVSFGTMIECENESCSIEWFHFKCVKLKTEPKGKW